MPLLLPQCHQSKADNNENEFLPRRAGGKRVEWDRFRVDIIHCADRNHIAVTQIQTFSKWGCLIQIYSPHRNYGKLIFQSQTGNFQIFSQNVFPELRLKMRSLLKDVTKIFPYHLAPFCFHHFISGLWRSLFFSIIFLYSESHWKK